MTRLTLIQRFTAASRAAAARRSFSASAPEAGKHQMVCEGFLFRAIGQPLSHRQPFPFLSRSGNS